MSKSKCPSCGALSIRSGATKCPACQAWVQAPKFSKRRLRLGPLGVIGFTVGLCIAGMVSGVVAAVTAQGRRHPARVVASPSGQDALPGSSASDTPTAAGSTSASAVALASTAAPEAMSANAAKDPPSVEGKFVKTAQVRLDAPPAGILFSEDNTQFFVLAEDGTLRAHDVETGTEKRRVKLPGRGKGLKSLPGSRLAIVGLPAEIAVIDEAAWAGGRPEAEWLKRYPVRDIVDLVVVGEPARVVGMTGQGKVVRLSADLSTTDAEFVSIPPVQSLGTVRAGDAERLVMLVSQRPPADSGAVIVCDPTIDPLGSSRAVWSAVGDPRVSRRTGSDKLLLFDAASATVVDFSVGGDRRVAPSGPQAMAAFSWVGDRAVVIGATGTATVVSLGRREVESTLSLGDVPSDAVATPDRRVVLVALGGPKGGRGAKTVVLAGEPLAVESTIATGEGSQVIAMGSKGNHVAVGAVAGRAVTILVRK